MNLGNIDLSRALISVDDPTIRAFLLSENLLGRLEPEPPADTASLAWRSEDTHTYCFCSNSRVPNDSGYTLVMLPFDQYTPHEAAEIIATIQHYDNPHPGTERAMLLDLHPTNN